MARVAKVELNQVETKLGEGGEEGDAPVQSADRHTPQWQNAQSETETDEQRAKGVHHTRHTTDRGES